MAVNHSGDSDSTGSMTGNLLGAHLGLGGLPRPWLDELEMREQIERLKGKMTLLRHLAALRQETLGGFLFAESHNENGHTKRLGFRVHVYHRP